MSVTQETHTSGKDHGPGKIPVPAEPVPEGDCDPLWCDGDRQFGFCCMQLSGKGRDPGNGEKDLVRGIQYLFMPETGQAAVQAG